MVRKLGQVRKLINKRNRCLTFRADGVPTEAKNLFMNFKNSQNKDFKMFGGGGPVSGDPCNNQHWHGFIGIESQVTAHIIKWIKEQI